MTSIPPSLARNGSVAPVLQDVPRGSVNPEGGRRRMTAQDVWAVKRLGAPALSPDGGRAVFGVQEWSVDSGECTENLWVVDTAGGAPRRLTTARAKDGSPAWSPDGRRVAFVSKRDQDECAALYVIAADGGEAEKVLELPYAVMSPKWLPDGCRLVVATSVIPALAGAMAAADLAAMKLEVKRRKESKMTAKVTEDRQFRFFDHYLTDGLATRLVEVDVATRGIRDLTPWSGRLFGMDGEVDYAISPDGRRLVFSMNSTPPPYREFMKHDLYLLDLAGAGEPVCLTADNPGGDFDAVFSPDGGTIYYLRTAEACYNGVFTRLWRHDPASGVQGPVEGLPDLSVGCLRVSPDGRTLWLLAEDRGRTPVFRLDSAGGGFATVFGEGTSRGLEVAGGSVVFLNSRLGRPDELHHLDPATGGVRALTDFNGALLAGLDLGEVEEFTFEGAAGDSVHGWILRPPGFDPAVRYPMVQVLHGGPHTMAADVWGHRWNAHVFAAAGVVVVQVNRHGSSGFGEAFARSIVNEWGVKPFEDIMKATDFLLEKLPNLDPARIAVAGASYGGYLAAWVLGHTDRFACIVDHAGVNNLYNQFACDSPHTFAEVFGGTPWRNVEGMQRNNPMAHAANFRTPTLVLHGELDYRVPYYSGLELYASLQAQGVSSRLVVFPNENHWILSPQNSIHWYWEVNHWLARHLGLALTEAPVFTPPDSGIPNPG